MIPAYVANNLGKLKLQRTIHSLTASRVAEALGVSTATFYDYENGNSMPERRIYNRLARLFSWEVWK